MAATTATTGGSRAGGLRLRTRVGGWAQFAVPILVALLAWQVVSALGLLPVIALPEPARVAEEAGDLLASGQLGREVATTLGRTLAALAIAAAFGVAGGLLIGRIEAVRRATQPLVRVGFPIPKIALYPGLMILFGAGAASQVNQKLVWSAQALGTSGIRLVTRVILPGALPGVLTALRVGLVGAIVGVFLGEMIAGSDGLGQMMARGWTLLQSSQMYVALITIALLGLIMDSLLLAARRWLLRGSDEE